MSKARELADLIGANGEVKVGKVGTAVSNLVDSAPAALNTLNELAAALGDDANFSTTVTDSIALKAPIASPTFTGGLNVTGIATTDGLTTEVTNAGESAALKIGNQYTAGLAVSALEFTSAGGAVKASIGAAVYNQGWMSFRTNNNTEKMRLEHNGNLGIGTTIPTAKLDVNDAGATDNAWNVLAKFRPDISDSSAESGIHIQSYPSSTVVADRAAGIQALDDVGVVRPLLLNRSGGNVGIGTTSPATELHVSSANETRVAIENSSQRRYDLIAGNSGEFRVYDTAVGDRLVISAAGSVGIGTSSPNEKLHVTGSLLLDADNAEINLKSGVGGTSGSINWTYNTTGTDYASIKLPYNTRASTGLHIDSGYPITIDSSSGTGIKFDVSGANRATITGTGLSVNGSILANSSGGTDNYYITGSEAGSTRYSVYENGNTVYQNSYDSMRFRANVHGGANGVMSFTGGNVGIGAITPTTELEVTGTSKTDNLIIAGGTVLNIAKGQSSQYNGLITHSLHLGAPPAGVTTAFLRIKKSWWGAGSFIITIREKYFSGNGYARFRVHGNNSIQHSGTMSLSTIETHGSAPGLVLSAKQTAAPAHARTGYNDISLAMPSYKTYHVTIEVTGSDLKEDDASLTTSNNAYRLLV